MKEHINDFEQFLSENITVEESKRSSHLNLKSIRSVTEAKVLKPPLVLLGTSASLRISPI